MKKVINRLNGKILGSIIKMNRLHQNMSQKALSEGICVSSYLSRIENAEISPSEQVISELFEALGIHYNDSDSFIEEGQALLNHFLDELVFNEFSNSRLIFEQIEQREAMFRHSPLIIDYTIVRLAFYCTRMERDIFESTRSLLESVEELMTNGQRFKFYLYSGIDTVKVYRDYDKSLETFNRAKCYGSNGHLIYWLGYTYLELGNYIKAFEMFNEALGRYVSEGNLLSIIASYEMLGLTHYRSGSYHDGLEYFNRGIKLAMKADAIDYVATFLNNIAWGHLCTQDFNGALMFNQSSKQKLMTESSVHISVIEFFANLERENPMCISEHHLDFQGQDSPVMITFGALFEHSERINWADKIINHEETLKKLIDEAEGVNFELAKYLKTMMVRFYKGKRKYKEALEFIVRGA